MSTANDGVETHPETEKCRHCGGKLVSVLPNVCPRCLLACALAADTDGFGIVTGTGKTAAASEAGPVMLPPLQELTVQFPDYAWVRLLGQGGMGAVYLAEKKDGGGPVAAKVLFPELSQRYPGLLERFRREASLLGLLNHPTIVRVLDYHESEAGYACLVMEYVEGVDLARLMAARGRLEQAEALHIVAQVAEALRHVHQKGVMHRDVKPANVLRARDGTVKLADFGLARNVPAPASGGLTRIDDTLGTPGYMAPELANRLGADERSDVYSLGVMLYHMLTGRIPQGFFELPSHWIKGVDAGVDRLIAAAMRHDPADRIPSVEQFHGEVQKLLGEDEESAGKKEPGREKGLLAGPIGTPTLCVLLSLPLLACLAAYLFWHFRGEAMEGLADARGASVQSPFVNSLGMRFVPIRKTRPDAAQGSLVLISAWEVRVRDFAAYSREASAQMPVPSHPPQQEDHPYAHASWMDAKSFCKWLTEKELNSKHIPAESAYRLPTDREWSEAAGIADREDWSLSTIARESSLRGVYLWGKAWPPPQGAGNLCDRDSLRARRGASHLSDYADGFPATAPVGSFTAVNGIQDMAGNVWEWVEDVYDPKGGGNRILRGGSWDSPSEKTLLEAADRHGADPYDHSTQGIFGFRPVLEITKP